MTTSQLKKIYGLLKRAYKELEDQALKEGVNVTSKEYEALQAKVREAVLKQSGFTLEQYRTADQEYKNSKDGINHAIANGNITDLIAKTMGTVSDLGKVGVRLSDTEIEVTNLKAEVQGLKDIIKSLAIPTLNDITSIAEKVVKPPRIINQIVRETTIEKPKIIKETRVEKVIEEKSYNDKAIQSSINQIKVSLGKVPTVEQFKEAIRPDIDTSLKETINILGMPDFRKLAMGLQGQIDEAKKISNGFLLTNDTIDDSNVSFKFAQRPSLIIINSGAYKETGGAITWTWSEPTKTATLSGPVGTGGGIFGLK